MNRTELLARLAAVLDSEAFARAAQDIESLAVGENHWLVRVLEAATDLPLPEVPEVVTQDLKALFPHEGLVLALEAILVSDSRQVSGLVGVRGAPVGQGWSLTYASEAADLVIDIWPAGEGQLEVEGQVMAYGAAESAYRASIRGSRSVDVEGDRLGRFLLGSLPPDRYRLTVGNNKVELTMDLDLTDGAQ